MKYGTETCSDFIEMLSSKMPAPGGGGASALVAAVGTALGNMVGSLTVGKKKYADVEEEMIRLKSEADQLQRDFLLLMDRDAEVFGPLAEAYSLPSGTEEEKAEKARVIELATREACTVPMEIMEKCCDALELADEFARKGSKIAVSDAGVAAVCLKAALQGAGLNVFINTKLMKDRETASALNEKAGSLLTKGIAKADQIYDLVLAAVR